MSVIGQARKHLVEFSKKLEKYNLSAYAGQTAFFMMLSFFPFLLFFFSLLNLTPLTERDFMTFMATLFPESFHNLLEGFAREIYKGTTGRISLTVLSAIFLSSKAFLAVEQGLNGIYEVKGEKNYLLFRIYGMLYSVIFAVVMILVLAIMVFGKWFHHLFMVKIPIVGEIIGRFIDYRVWVSALVLFVFLWALYSFLPNKKLRLKSQVYGAVFSALGWILFSYGFSIYVNRFNNYASFYGTMTTIALVMVWLYGCMYMFFLGGLINQHMEEMEN